MNKQQRDYTIERIRDIAKGKQFECECETPSLVAHIRRAIAGDSAKMKPSKEINEILKEKILDGERYYGDVKVGLDCLYEAPQSYKNVVAEQTKEKDSHTKENQDIWKFAKSLIDRVELGEFEDGKEPILLMESYEPTKPNSSAKKR